jgi:hypothetical protein
LPPPTQLPAPVYAPPPAFGAFPAPAPGVGVAPPGWTPPPRPGLIPLAPLTLGGILGGSFRVLRRNPRPVVGFSLIIHGVLAIFGVLITGNAVNSVSSLLTKVSNGGVPTTGQTGGLVLAYLGEFAVIAIGLVASQILQGIITVEVARGTVGERLRLRGLWARARGRLLVLVGWAFALVGIVLGLTIVIGIVLVVVVAVLAAGSNGSGAALGIGILMLVLVTLGGLLLGLWIGVKLSLVPSILVLERLTLGKAMARSWSLMRGYFWRTLGIELLVWLMLAIASQIIQAPVAVVVLITSGLGHPTGASAAATLSSLGVGQVATTLVGELVAAITGIIGTASTALIYIDLRMRKEGLDLALLKFVDDRAAGNPEAADPYLAPALPQPPMPAPPMSPPPYPGPPPPDPRLSYPGPA